MLGRQKHKQLTCPVVQDLRGHIERGSEHALCQGPLREVASQPEISYLGESAVAKMERGGERGFRSKRQAFLRSQGEDHRTVC